MPRRRGREGLRLEEIERAPLLRSVLALVLWLRRAGWRLVQIARELELSASTLRRWLLRRARRRVVRRRRGRKRVAPRPEHRRDALRDALAEPRVGARELGRRYPSLTRREAERIKARARALRDDRGYRLRWTRAGAVWSLDYTQPPSLVEGRYGRVLLVRDLASGESLATVAMEGESAAEVALVLGGLFREHGAPLVLKSDNGGTLVAGPIPALLAAWGVVPLRSPPYTPRYNGACEAGVGSIKRGAESLARAAGRPGVWTLDELEAARLYANEFGRPRGARASPDSVWGAREHIGPEERRRFLGEVALARQRETARALAGNVSPCKAELARIERAAVSAVLAKLHYLDFRRA